MVPSKRSQTPCGVMVESEIGAERSGGIAKGKMETDIDSESDSDAATDADGPGDDLVALGSVDVGGIDVDLDHCLGVVEVVDDLLGAMVEAANEFVFLAKVLEDEDVVL